MVKLKPWLVAHSHQPSKVLLMIIAMCLTGCELPYYWQAAQGQWQILQQRQPISDIIAADTTPESHKQKLTTLLRAREFAMTQLQLENNDSYLSYVHLDREYVVWNVFATPELSMDNQTWCYPIAGCVSYRGYFSKQAAEHYAAKMAHQGFDTYVGGVDAYSTLGWFDDAVLSTFLKRDSVNLVALLFHELAHQTLYVKGDTQFNESYASSLERILLQKWLQSQPQQWQLYVQARQRQQAFLTLILENKKQRQDVFESTLPNQEKRQKKQQLILQLQQSYHDFKQQWPGFDGYQHWFSKGLNNAQLSTVATYNELLPGFLAFYHLHQENLKDFIQGCQKLAALEPEERTQKLNQLGEAGLYSH